jgi:hypothetical protein
MLIASRENACEFIFWSLLSFADLTHVQRDASRK